MKKLIYTIAIAVVIMLTGNQTFAAPHGPHDGGGRPPMHGGVSAGHRPMGNPPPMHNGGYRPHVAGMPPHHHMGVGRPLPPPPPIHRPRVRPYYPYYYSSSVYYPTYSYYPATNYVYESVVTAPPVVTETIVRDPYVGVNTAANVINAAANVATMVRFWTW